MLHMRKKIRTLQNSKAHLLYRLAYEYEEFFTGICFVKCWPLPQHVALKAKFHEAAFFPLKKYALFRPV